MGFGLLVIGYFLSTLMSTHAYGWATEILGFYFMFLALSKLWEYKHSFKRCLWPLVLMTLCQTFVGFRHLFAEIVAEDAFALFGVLRIDDLINTVFVTVLMVFHFLLLSSIRELALDVEDELLARLARRYFFIVGAYFFFNITVAFLPKGSGTPVLALISVLASVAYPLFVLYLLIRCYARICAPEDADMKQKPSRFAFINKRRAMRKKFDEAMDKRIKDLEPKENPKK